MEIIVAKLGNEIYGLINQLFSVATLRYAKPTLHWLISDNV